MWPPEHRAKAVGLYTMAPVLGPVIGPIAAGWIAERTTWRWVFWSTSILAGTTQVLGFFFLCETYAPFLLQQKLNRLTKETGNTSLHLAAPRKRPLAALGDALIRPSRMLATQPIVQVIALYMAYIFGLSALLIVSFPTIWTHVYHESVGVGGLNYLSLGVGTFVGIGLAFRFGVKNYAQRKERNGGVGRPEWRLPLMFIGSAVTPIGLLWFGWSVEAKAHWIVPNLGIVVFTAGMVLCLQGMQTYMLDTYATYAASGLAAAVVLRSLCGFAFPLFAPYMYERLGYGWGTSLLALISVVIGVPAPLVFWRWGESLRRASKYATA
jgi:MFS family permease